jgi:uracil-DNA glycosylase
MTHQPAPPFKHSAGPRDAKIALVGEAFGREEDLTGCPFVGQSGQELTRILSDAGIARGSCFLTNTFAFRPQDNDILSLCGKKAEVLEASPEYALAPISSGKYIHPQYLGELDRLYEELAQVQPNVIVPLGNIACWALLGSGGISNLRGTVAETPRGKVLPTYHPAAVLRQWAYRPIVVADLMKAKREAETPVVLRRRRELTICPTHPEICNWIENYARDAAYLTCDIETFSGQIDMIGFASSPDHAICIPFFDNQTKENFWPTPEDEAEAYRLVQLILGLPCPKVFQNGLYDLQYLYKMGFRVRNALHDTMLLHHSLYPELQKGLGFLGSLYCNEVSWKLLNKRRAADVVKADE